MLARRLLIVLAVLIGLTALASGVTPRAPVVQEDRSPAPPAADPPPVLERTLDAGATGQRVLARVGQTVVITVEGSSLGTVRLAEFGNETVDRDSPARFELLVDVPGSYAIEMIESERRIGTLEVRAEDAPQPAAPAGAGEVAS